MKTCLCSLPLFVAALLMPVVCPAFQQDDDAFTSKFQNSPPESDDRGPQMSEQDRERMKAIREKMSKSADVEKAKEAVKSAQTPDEKRAAMKALRETMDKSLSAEDRAFMEKIRKQHPERNKQGGQEGGPRHGPRGRDGNGTEGFGPGPGFGDDGQPPRRGPQGTGDGGQRGGSRPGFGDGGPRPQPQALTEEQRTRLQAIRAKYKDDPAVTAARQAVQQAVTPEERELALDEYRTAVRKQLNEEDRAFLDEFRKNRMQHRPSQPPPGGERF